jgi:hypothetical protein
MDSAAPTLSLMVSNLVTTKSHCKPPLAKTFAEILNLQRPLLQREIQCNPVTHSLYSSSYNHVAAFLLVLAQKVPHLMGQSSTTCTLVANLIVYLESHLLCALTPKFLLFSFTSFCNF